MFHLGNTHFEKKKRIFFRLPMQTVSYERNNIIQEKKIKEKIERSTYLFPVHRLVG